MSLSIVTLPVSVARLPAQAGGVMVRVGVSLSSARLGSIVTVPQEALLPPPAPIGTAPLPHVASTRSMPAPMEMSPQVAL